MPHAIFEATGSAPELEEVRAAMLEVDLIALRLRVAMAKADLQMRSASCAALHHSTLERLLSRTARDEQRDHLLDMRAAVTRYAHVLGTTGATQAQVMRLVRETVDEVTPAGASESITVREAAARAVEVYYDAPAA